ncbi:MAG TPA: aminoglycoside phosphotransferase family protein [Rubrobacter sp.]|nr:aminoglycoside phosphotransferase family protein [Rubrobacter sp.]
MEPSDDQRFTEVTLTGGFVSPVAKVGDTVRRGTGPWTPAVHALLNHLEDVDFDGAPRVLGTDGRGREVLSFVPGEVPDRASPEVATEGVLAQVGRLLRRYHDAVRGFELPTGIRWHHRPIPGDETVVCHNDISPRNTVFRDARPVAFVDWDLATPAPPAWDVAHAAWQFVPLADDAGCRRHGWPAPPDRAHRLRVLCDGYGLTDADRAGFSALVARRIETTASGIEELAARGVAAHERLVRIGIPALVRADGAWVGLHAGELDAALVPKGGRRSHNSRAT